MSSYPPGFNEWPIERKNEFFAKEARNYRDRESAARPNGEEKNDAGLVFTRLSDVESENVPWLWFNRIPHCRLSLLTGAPGLGKSQITAFVAAKVSTGRAWPDGEPCGATGSVVFLSAEDNVADTIKPRCQSAGADSSKIVVIEAVRHSNGKERGFDLSGDLEHLEKICLSEKAVLVVIDPISAYLGRKVDGHSNSDIRSILGPLAKFAEKYRVTVLAITHNRKSGGAALESMIGSIAFGAAPRAVWGVIREVGDDGELTGRTILTPVKCNLGPPPDGLAYVIESDRVSSERDPDGISTSRIRWYADPITKSADELYAALADPGKRREAPERDGAEEFLRGLLADGPLPKSKIEEEAKAAGFAWRTIRRAKDDLGIRPYKAHTPPYNWIWDRPANKANGPHSSWPRNSRPGQDGQHGQHDDGDGEWGFD
jgi:AAA domain